MWKALIKLVESWSYKCDHDWEEVAETSVYDATSRDKIKDQIPTGLIYTYRCTKCMKIKKVKI